MKKRSNLTYFFVTLIFFTSSDFYLSNLIIKNLSNGLNLSSSLMNVVYIENTGAAFSILQNSTTLLIALSILGILAIFYYVFKYCEKISMKEILFISFLASGILGNLYERLAFGYVRDFFDLTFINFPIFNISDIFINIGVFGIIILILLTKNPLKKHE